MFVPKTLCVVMAVKVSQYIVIADIIQVLDSHIHMKTVQPATSCLLRPQSSNLEFPV
jgi:hypothetical protein